MPKLRAEQIILAVISQVKSLTTTKSKVYRSDPYNRQQVDLPALEVSQGPEETLAENNVYIDSNLTYSITIVINNKNPESVLNKIRKEIQIAMYADRKLGLSGFVVDTMLESVGTPTISGEGNNIISEMVLTWVTRYRYSTTDPSA